MWITIQTFFIKWGLELFVGLLGIIGLYFRKEIVEFWKYKKSLQKKDDLKEVYAKIDREKQISIKADKEILGTLDKEILNVKKEMHKVDNEILDKMVKMEQRIMDILEPLRQATLSSHLDSLILRCQEFVIQGWISPDDYDRIEADYKTYKSLGGNGHMDDWMAKVRKLPIKNREEQ